jgi:DNA polymerase theta
VSVLCATSTLAAGVNLPVRRVIFRHDWIGWSSNPIDSVRYAQMAGRAGRAGIDERGESILLGREGNKVSAKQCSSSPAAPPGRCESPAPTLKPSRNLTYSPDPIGYSN